MNEYLTSPAERRDCTEALQHGPSDGAGRCPWCHRRYDSPISVRIPYDGTSNLTLAYRRFYDPDWGTGLADFDPT